MSGSFGEKHRPECYSVGLPDVLKINQKIAETGKKNSKT
jgi:hypothetical protein